MKEEDSLFLNKMARVSCMKLALAEISTSVQLVCYGNGKYVFGWNIFSLQNLVMMS